jgi:prepilin-type N-terminal cleavage/methylation domain-containing protein
MKKGFSIIEIITVLAVLAVVAVPLSRLYKLAAYDIPKSFRLVETNTSILNVLKYIKKDVNSAVSFPQSFGGYTTDDKCLLIKQKNKTVCYLIEQDKISRIEIDKEKEKITWRIPDGQIEWQVWQKNGEGFAVEIRKYVKLKGYNFVEKKMENAYVYFAGISQEAVN